MINFIGIFLLLGGLILLIFGFVFLKRKMLIQNTPTSKVRSIAMGFVELYGSVVPKEILKSPFTKSDCVYYKYYIQEYRQNAKGGGTWYTVKQGKDMKNFYLQDETGQVLVDPAKAEIDIQKKGEYNSGMGQEPSQIIQNFLATQNLKHETFFGFNKKMKYIEYFLAPNEKIYIMGTAKDNPFVNETTGQKNESDIMIQKGNNYYLISGKSEKEILNSLRWQVPLFFIISVILIVIGLIIVF